MTPDLPPRVFLLSPANCGGVRMGLLLRPMSKLPLTHQLRSREGARIDELFSFASGLYFRGKVAYVHAFGRASARVIAPGMGLVPLDERLTEIGLRAMADVPVDLDDERYRLPLERDAKKLARAVADAEVVLLGSVASTKYTDVLLSIFGRRLLFPRDFVGRGDLSRGGLLLRSAREGSELAYESVEGAVVRGRRPPRLPRPPRVRPRS